MRSIIISLIMIASSICYASHTLLIDIPWESNVKIQNMTIKSMFFLRSQKIRQISLIYSYSKHMFFNEFESMCDERNFADLEIRIIRPDILRNTDYFPTANRLDFGRYFSSSNILYIIPDMFNKPEYLAHELAHYFYDECKIKFLNDKEEHKKVNKFERLYKERNNHKR